jgi:hypothetical protein
MTHRWVLFAAAILGTAEGSVPLDGSLESRETVSAPIEDPCPDLCSTIVYDCPDGVVPRCVNGFCESIYIFDNRLGYYQGAVDIAWERLTCTRASELLVSLGFKAPSSETDKDEPEVPERSHGAMVLVGKVRPPPAKTTSTTTPASGR